MARGALKDIIIGFYTIALLLVVSWAVNSSGMGSELKFVFNIITSAASVIALVMAIVMSSIRQRMYDAELKLQQEIQE
jgi:RsiW-degrading membrane proteinase PrsW (M82 family)